MVASVFFRCGWSNREQKPRGSLPRPRRSLLTKYVFRSPTVPRATLLSRSHPRTEFHSWDQILRFISPRTGLRIRSSDFGPFHLVEIPLSPTVVISRSPIRLRQPIFNVYFRSLVNSFNGSRLRTNIFTNPPRQFPRSRPVAISHWRKLLPDKGLALLTELL